MTIITKEGTLLKASWYPLLIEAEKKCVADLKAGKPTGAAGQMNGCLAECALPSGITRAMLEWPDKHLGVFVSDLAHRRR